MNNEETANSLKNQIKVSHDVCEWLRSSTLTLSFKTTKRNKLACASHGLALEHHEGLVNLIAMSKVGPGLVLTRSILDSHVIGLWISNIATPDQLNAFVNNTISTNLKKMLQNLKDKSSFTSQMFKELFELVDEMNGFTHGNISQLHWRYSSTDIRPRYPEHFQIAVLRTASVFAYLSAYEFQTLSNHIDLRNKMYLEANKRLGFDFLDYSGITKP